MMKTTTVEELSKREVFKLTPTKSQRILKAEPVKSGDLVAGLVVVCDTSKGKYEDIYFSVFPLPQVKTLYMLDGHGQNFFAEPSTGVTLEDLASLIDSAIPQGTRSRKGYPHSLESICQLRYWRFPGTFWCQNNADVLKAIRGDIGNLIPGFPNRFRIEKSCEANQDFQYICDELGQTRGVVYSSLTDVIVSWIPENEDEPQVREDRYVYSVDKLTHTISLTGVEG